MNPLQPPELPDAPYHQRHGAAKALAGTAAAASLLVPVQLAVRAIAPRSQPHLPRLFHRALSRSLGVTVRLHGAPARRGGVLFVSNHLSWTDIPVIGSKLLGHFVAKSEVGAMGPVGWFADLQNTIYVDRDRRHRAGEQRGVIAERLAAGGNVILFPEGTTGDGIRVLPFKSSLFAATDGVEDALIQPVSLAYTRINGLPVRREHLVELAWIGDVEIGPHAHDFVRLGKVRADILLHEAVRPSDFPDRKALSRHCERVVAEGYARLMRA
ncbi:MAG: 1-acyl-sn-glycerol-3-phosphate acyltransferase [Alphaproteobacteria bacterium]|nr:1-acyl-sn-glycerol-3-phosphate acyltransferase [Alphaproteobacteria bacterium]